ncbi:hypothetical protein CPB83DRAFT_857613 [Crepidotus variabilis]|uniref:Calcineurin-like phosphoesterase domain-containing protein n=1 Tax=Crepidotus variabilis TaxID=179855 RepID=A0A9P6ECS9_9AGAR|nr:hypothetical protein CPB83DRAFT_857613 [Crepidotus variabilis]
MVASMLKALARRSLHTHAFIIPALRLFWVVTALIGELGVFYWSLGGCRWPKINIGHETRQPVPTKHVLLIADPQVQHPVLIAPKSWWSRPLRRILFELNLRKSWHVTSRLKPDVVIFMGDMLANGKAATTFEQYDFAAQKFKSIFDVDPSTEIHYVPGNNDVGLGLLPAASQKLRAYYTRSFGPLNQQLIIQNHTFVALDAPGLIDEDYLRHGTEVTFAEWKPLPEGSISFAKAISAYDPERVILLSHVPLSRSETAYCGPLRERGSIRRGAGQGWQSMLGKQTSRFLLESLQPILVYSADNRDYCEHKHLIPTRGQSNSHRTYDETTREVTLKSFSMSVHIHQPGFQLLSLVDPAKLANPSLNSFADTTCFLPDQYSIYSSLYAPLFGISLLGLLILNFKDLFNKRTRKSFGGLSLHRSPMDSGPNSPNLQSSLWSPFAPFSPVAPGIKPSSPRGKLPPHLRTPHNGSASHLVASSRPGTPMSPSFLSVPGPFREKRDEEGYAGYEDDEDDMMPAQYANHNNSLPGSRSGSRRNSLDNLGMGLGGHPWSHLASRGQSRQPSFVDDDDDYDMLHDEAEQALDQEAAPMMRTGPTSTFAGRTSTQKWRWSKSFTFVLRGSLRRVTIGIPSWTGVYNLLDLVGLETGETGSLTTPSTIRSRRQGKKGLTTLLLDFLSVFWPSVVVWAIINWTIL